MTYYDKEQKRLRKNLRQMAISTYTAKEQNGEFIGRIQSGINQLTTRQQQVLHFRFTEGKDRRATAHILGMTIDNIKNTENNALRSLRRMLGISI